MKSVLAGAIVSAVMMAGAPAYAVTVTPGPATQTFVEGPQSAPVDSFVLGRQPPINKLPASGATFTDYYTFSVMANTELQTFVGATGTGTPNNAPQGVTLSLYSGAVPGQGTFITSVSTLQYIDTILAMGNYYLQVSGLSKGPGGSYGGSASFSSTVPLPNSVALFGVAIAGLGIAGAARRRSSKAAV